MKANEFKKIAEALGKFATTRETATPPQASIGVQALGGTLKLIAGNSRAGITVGVVGATLEGDARFTVSARPFLQSAKVLPARSEIDVRVEKDKLVIVAEGGGEIVLPNTGTIKEAGFPKKPKEFRAEGNIDGVEWKRISSLFKQVSAKVEVPSVQLISDTAYATAIAPGNRSRYVSYAFPGSGDNEYNMSGYLDFWVGLTALSVDGVLRWGRGGILASTENVEVFSAPYLLSRYDPERKVAHEPEEAPAWPILKLSGELPIGITMSRKDLIEIIRGQAPFDEQNRITLEVDTDFVKVTPFGGESGQKVSAKTDGRGIRSVRADYLGGLLSSMDSKEVALRWGTGNPAISISAEGYSNWTILLAPVVL